MARRVSITKLQRRTAAAVELIALCQTITADGRLADDEIAAFKQWLTDNKHVDLPAKDFLALTVTKILSDGTVADEERDEPYAAIEAALPLDVREDVRGRRRALQDADRKQRRIEREAAHAARMRDTPLETWDFMVAGSLYEGRPAVIEKYAGIGDPVYLVSANAIEPAILRRTKGNAQEISPKSQNADGSGASSANLSVGSVNVTNPSSHG
jgi:hypothetical protein